MLHQTSRELFHYWNALRGGRSAPERADVDLAAIRSLIGDMFMLEVDGAYRFPFVLSGTRVNALVCGEQMGRSFLDLWPAHEARSIAAMLLTVMDASRPMVVTAAAAPIGGADLEVEILFLPLGHHRQARARILGLITPEAPTSWLGLRPIVELKLQTIHTIDDATTSHEFDVRTVFKTALASAQAKQSDKPTRNVGHLRVIEGGRKIS